MTNIGFVLYTKNSDPGKMDAKWCHSDYGDGTGIATGGSVEGFEGHYHIQYFDDLGNIVADRELEIKKDSDNYKVLWLNNGKITAVGIGMENSEGLSVGYRDV